MWDEVETYYNEEENSSKRRKCREWGIVYVIDIDNVFHLKAKDTIENKGIDGVTIVLVETGNTVITNEEGSAELKSSIVDEATFRFTHPDYVPQDVVVLLLHGTTVYNVTAMMVPL